MATGLLVVKTLIKYNSNNSEENEEEKEPINIEFTEQNTDPYNDENAIDFRWSDVQEEEENIALANFIQSLLKQTDEEIFLKVTRWLFDVCVIVLNEKKI